MERIAECWVTFYAIFIIDNFIDDHGSWPMSAWEFLLTVTVNCITVSFIARTTNHSVTTGITQHMIFFNLKVVTITVLDLGYAKQTKRNSRIVNMFSFAKSGLIISSVFGLNLTPLIYTHSITQNVYFLNIHRHCGSSSQAAIETN